MKLFIKKGTTSKTLLVFIQDSSSTTGAGLTGLAWNTASLSWYFYREGAGTGATQVTLATQTIGTWATGGFVELDATDMPGWYELGVPNAVLATGVDFVGLQLKGAANMAPLNIEIQLTTFDPNDSVRLGMTALPNAAADAIGGLTISAAGGLDMDAMNTAAVRLTAVRAAVLTDWINAGRLDNLLDAIPTTAMRGTDNVVVAGPTKSQMDTAHGLLATPTNITAGTIATLTNAPPDSSGVTTLLGRIPAALFSGITSLAEWLGLMAGDQVADAAALAEIKTSGAGSGTYDESTDSLEAIAGAGGGGAPTVQQIRTEMDSNSTQLAAIVLDTDELQTDWKNTGRLDNLLDAIPTTAMRGTDNVVVAGPTKSQMDTAHGLLATEAKQDIIDTVVDGLATTIGAVGGGLTNIPWNSSWDTEVQSKVIDALQETVPDSIPADGARPSVQQGIYMTTQRVTEFSISGTTLTVKKPDGTTTLYTLTLNNDTTPTSVTRAN